MFGTDFLYLALKSVQLSVLKPGNEFKEIRPEENPSSFVLSNFHH